MQVETLLVIPLKKEHFLKFSKIWFEHFKIKHGGHRACFCATGIAINSNYTTCKVLMRNPGNQN